MLRTADGQQAGGASSPPRSTAAPRPDGEPPLAAAMTAAAAPAVGKKDLACCRREPTARAEEHSPEAACVTCSCRTCCWATSAVQVNGPLSGGQPGRTTGTPDQRRETQVLRDPAGIRVG